MRLKDTFITHDSDGEQVLIDVPAHLQDLSEATRQRLLLWSA